MSGGFYRKKRILSKHFCLIPTFINNKWIWLKFIYTYKTYGHGMVLGGSVDTHYDSTGKYVRYTSRQGSFFPHTKTLWKGDSLKQLRTYLRSEPYYENKYRKAKNHFSQLLKFEAFLNSTKGT